MTCREFVEFLMDFLSGELPGSQQKVFQEHLGVCGDCVRYLENYKAMLRLEKLAFSDPDDDLPAEVPEELVRAILAARPRD